jgi:CRISPR/Cas system CSM-associated protein Csm3 (group 7 of RAMP superfamily)
LELEDATEEDKILLSAILAEWQAGRAWLGGARARGLGRASLENVNYWSNHLSNSGELLSYLRSKNPLDSAEKDVAWIKDHTAKARTNYHLDRAGRPFVEARFFLKFDGLFLTQDTALSGFLGFDYVSLLDGIPTPGRELIPILPGAGLRGSLRSQAEKIVRTLASHNALAHGDFAEKQFLITCPACDPTQENPEKPLTKCAEIDNLKGSKDEAEEKHLCLACRLFGSSRRGSRLSVMDASLHGDPVWKVMDFLAIDRFTGGGLESAKFDAVALWQPTFRAQLFLEDPEDWELGWLAYVLRDLVDRRITFGFGGGKGFGRATAEGMKFIFGFTKSSDWDFSLEEHELKEAAGFYRVAAFSGKEWSGAQRPVADWIEAFHQEVANFRRDPRALLPLRSDSYFGSVSELYPMKEADHA